MRGWAIAAIVGLVALLGACSRGDSESVTVIDARVGAPAGPNAALSFTAIGGDEDDRLVGARSAVASEIQIHETVTGDDGAVGMRPVEGLDLPAGQRLVLEPGGCTSC